MPLRLPLILLLLVCPVLAADPRGAAAQEPAVADRADAYAAAVRHHREKAARNFMLDPLGLADEAADSASGTPEIVSRLLATGLFAGVCARPTRAGRPVCPDSVPATRVRISGPERITRDTLHFVVTYASIRRGRSSRAYVVSWWYRVVRVDGVWTVAETRRRAVT